MLKYVSILVLVFCLSCQGHQSIIRKHVTLEIYTYEYENATRAGAMPALKADSELKTYARRFEYLLMNVPEIHLPEKAEERNAIFSLYPDTVALQKRYLEKYTEDKKLAAYFEATLAPITNPNLEKSNAFTVDELMEVASKFFYCDLVNPDTSIQAHVCVGLNGVNEARWQKDYTLLEAFCYEAIFHDFDHEISPIWESFVSAKEKSAEHFKTNLVTLDQYLEDVKLDVFEKMKTDAVLKQQLLAYYELNKTNLAFKLIV